MTPEELEMYAEQATMVPNGTICTVDIAILRDLIECAQELYAYHNEYVSDPHVCSCCGEC